MNARGMVELIILNIGLERGILAPPMFSIMVFMTLFTTLLATPLFNLVWRSRRRGETEAARVAALTAG